MAWRRVKLAPQGSSDIMDIIGAGTSTLTVTGPFDVSSIDGNQLRENLHHSNTWYLIQYHATVGKKLNVRN